MRSWARYRSRFVEPLRIREGRAFLNEHAATFQRAEQFYGVPPAIVAAIIGVETEYGANTGGFRVLDALATLAFDFPPGRKDRSAFFRDELESFLVMCQQQALEPGRARERSAQRQPAALALRPGLREVLDAGADSGSLAGIVSGSGPTCAFLAANEDAAVRLSVALSGLGLCRTVRRASGPVPGARLQAS